MPLDKDQRKFVRTGVDIRIRVFAEVDGKPQMTYGRGHDLGEGGMAAYVALELAAGQEIGVEFELPGGRFKFGMRAIVRNAAGYRYGLEFLRMSRKESDELNRCLRIIALTMPTTRPKD